MKKLLIALSLLIATACDKFQPQPQPPENALLGKQYVDVVTLMGPPNQVLPDGNGGLILCYTSTNTHGVDLDAPTPMPTSGYKEKNGGLLASAVNGFMAGFYKPRVETNVITKMFFIDKNKMVYDWRESAR